MTNFHIYAFRSSDGVSKDKINHFCDSTSKLWKAATQLNGEDWTRMKLCWHCQWQCCCVDNDNAFQWHGLSKSGTRGNSVCDAVGHENDDDDTDDYMDMPMIWILISVHMEEKICRTPSRWWQEYAVFMQKKASPSRAPSSPFFKAPCITLHPIHQIIQEIFWRKTFEAVQDYDLIFLHFWEKITSQIHRLRNFQISHLLVLLSPEQTRYLAGKLEIPASTLHSLHLRILSRI